MQDPTRPKSELLRRLLLLAFEADVCDQDHRDGVAGGEGGNLKGSMSWVV